MLYLINRRKQLILCKRRKLKDEFQNRGDSRGKPVEEEANHARLSWFTSDPEGAGRVLAMLVKALPSLEEKKLAEEEKSNDFWNNNKKYENEIDMMLNKLKQIDYSVSSH